VSDWRLVFRRTRRANRPDAPRGGRAARLADRATISQCAELLHVVARPRSHATRDLCRVALARRAWGIGGGFGLCPAGRSRRSRAVYDLRGFWAGAIGRGAVSGGESRRSGDTGADAWWIAAAAFVGIFFLALPFPLIVLAAGLIGFWRAERGAREVAPAIAVSLRETAGTVAIWLAVWVVPLLGVAAALGRDHLLTALGWFFSKLAVVTFGGAYAVLAYMGQDVVTRFGWLTTPGPLILVTEFVGFTAAHNAAGIGAGLAGAAVALWATFAPCFLWIFAAAPYVEWINAQPRVRAALSAITAAVVGVIANLALWFGLHVFFADVTRSSIGPLTLWVPDVTTLDWRVVVLAGISGWLLLRRHWNVPLVLAVAAGLALVLRVSVGE